MDLRELFNDEIETIRSAMDARLSKVRTCVVGVVQAFDSVNLTVDVQAATMGIRQLPNNKASYEPLTLLSKVPVFCYRGGNALITMPVAVGDECLVVFSDRDTDTWWGTGGVNNVPFENRMHDLSDGFAIIGVFSKPNLPGSYSTTSIQVRSADGNTVVDLNPNSSKVTIKATTLEVDSTTVNVNATSAATVITPTLTVDGNLQVNGNINLTGVASGGGGTINVNGAIAATGDITANGTSVHSHEHSGVQPGSGVSGPPV